MQHCMTSKRVHGPAHGLWPAFASPSESGSSRRTTANSPQPPAIAQSVESGHPEVEASLVHMQIVNYRCGRVNSYLYDKTNTRNSELNT